MWVNLAPYAPAVGGRDRFQLKFWGHQTMAQE
jgi:hypothetical protein